MAKIKVKNPVVELDGDDWYELEGLPCLKDACASLLCTVASAHAIGTHELFVGRVHNVLIAEGGKPLCWHDGRFARTESLIASG